MKYLGISALALLTACAAASTADPELVAEITEAQTTPVTLVQPDGSYDTVPLEKDVITLKVLQTTVRNLSDYPTIEEGLESNLAHMKAMADEACTTGNKPDILLYHEFPLTGYSSGSRTEKLKYTVQMPGPETEFLGEIARNCDTYIIFGSYATDPDWPGHILSLNAVINTDGELVERYWKTRNIKRLYDDREISGIPRGEDGVWQYRRINRAIRSVCLRGLLNAGRGNHAADSHAVCGL
jgi:hypothetical protein